MTETTETIEFPPLRLFVAGETLTAEDRAWLLRNGVDPDTVPVGARIWGIRHEVT